jgi:SAM-dependent methyltransferase
LSALSLRERLLAIPPQERDAFVDDLLGLDEIPDDGVELPRGGVPYLPSGFAEILAMVDEVPLGAGDHLVDVGAGVGRVVLLAHLLTGARATGVEVQARLVAIARERAAALGLANVSFLHNDAGEVTMEGSVFYLYAPCNGELLARVLARLEDVARRHPIVVATVDLDLGAIPWLRARPTGRSSLRIFDSTLG